MTDTQALIGLLAALALVPVVIAILRTRRHPPRQLIPSRRDLTPPGRGERPHNRTSRTPAIASEARRGLTRKDSNGTHCTPVPRPASVTTSR